METKLYYENYVPLNKDFPFKINHYFAFVDHHDFDNIESDATEISYYKENTPPHIKVYKGKNTVPTDLSPLEIPPKWAKKVPPVIGFHMHRHMEINMVTEGSMLYFADRKVFELGKGDMIFFNTLMPHAWFVEKEGDAKIIALSCYIDEFTKSGGYSQSDLSFISQIVNSTVKYKFIKRTDGPANPMENLLFSMYQEYHEHRYAYEINIKMLFFSCLIELIRMINPNYSDMGKKANIIVTTAQHYIKQHLSENLSLRQIADVCFVTPQRLSFVFKKSFGIGISQYINQQRIAKAAELLQDSHYSILDVLNESGFSSKSNFYRVFREFYGIHPMKMRKAFYNEKL